MRFSSTDVVMSFLSVRGAMRMVLLLRSRRGILYLLDPG
jgi:hypothetical protein